MKLREQISNSQHAQSSDPPPDSAAPGVTLRKAEDLLSAADEAIRRVLSGNSQQFVLSNRQEGGQ